MRRVQTGVIALVSWLAWSVSPALAAPQGASAGAPPPASVGGDVVALQFEPRLWNRDVIRVGQDFTLGVDDAARNVTVVLANATIEGRVPGDVVVVLGEAHLAATAFIEGSIVVVGGSLRVDDGARVRRDLLVAAGTYQAPAVFSAGGDHIVIGPQSFGGRMAGLIDWLMRGLLYGRPIVPSLAWVWMVVAVLFFVQLFLNVVLDRPVTAVTATLRERPLTALMSGLAVALLLGPISVLLAVSIIGIAVVPLILGGFLCAWMLGRIATARWIGSGLFPQDDPSLRSASTRSFLIGAAVIVVVYMVPLLGFIAWATTSTFALGGAVLTFLAAYRKENPLPVRVAPAAVGEAAAAVPFPERAPFPEDVPMTTTTDTAPTAAAAGAGTMGLASDLTLFPRAAFRDRLAAGVLDLILVLLSWALLDPVVRENRIFLLILAYLIGFWTWKGTTVGGIICQLRVVRTDGQPLRFVDALVRGLSGIFSLMVLGLGFLWILKDPDRQSWHDRIAGTYVVKVPRNWPI